MESRSVKIEKGKKKFKSEKFRVAVIGCSGIAQAHMEAYKSIPEVEIVAGVDIQPERLKVMEEKWGIPRNALFTDWNEMLRKIKPDGVYYLCNNDGMTWCECENCKKLDSAEDKKNNFVSNRYWILYRELTKDIYKKYPDMQIMGCPYQNFQSPPADKNLLPGQGRLQLAFNSACWRHNMDDPDCPTNKVYHRYYQQWSKVKLPTGSWEQISHCGIDFLPIEYTVRDRLKYYEKINCEMFPEVWPPNITFPVMRNRYKNEMVFHQWECIWQGIYYMANYPCPTLAL